MKVNVYLTGLDDELEARVESFIHDNWSHVTVYETTETSPPKQGSNHEAILTIINGAIARPQSSTTRIKAIILNGQPVDEVLYQVNAKLGRLTATDIPSTNSAHPVESPLSRREFLFGMFGRTSAAAGPVEAPVVSAVSCEARFGCRKCVDVCPALGALELQQNSVFVSEQNCIRCGLCASICPVGAISVPELPETAFRGLLRALEKSAATRKTLVMTCCEEHVPKVPWVDVEHVPGVGVMGVRQLAMAVSTSINAIIVYCPDGMCVGKEHVKEAVQLIRSITKADPPSVYYLEGKEGAAEIERIHNSVPTRGSPAELPPTAWDGYVAAIENISIESSEITGLGFTDIRIAESCTLCNACVDKCPHTALRIENGELFFDSGKCTGCGYCRQICPEQAITLPDKRGSVEFFEKPVYKDEMVRCSECNAPYASVKMVRKVSATLGSIIPKCPACREKGAYQALFAVATSKSAS